MDENELIYRREDDPWGYFSAGEQAKYLSTLDAARRWKPRPARVLEAACSLGYMTRLLLEYAEKVWAYDISPTAVERTRSRCEDISGDRLHLCVGDALDPRYPCGWFDVIVIGDVGLFAHQDFGGAMIRKAIPLLRDDGILIVVDNMKPACQSEYVAFVERQGVTVVERIYFWDRYWMKFRSLIKRILPEPWARSILANPSVYHAFATLGRLRGPLGSKHFGVVARPTGSRPESP